MNISITINATDMPIDGMYPVLADFLGGIFIYLGIFVMAGIVCYFLMMWRGKRRKP